MKNFWLDRKAREDEEDDDTIILLSPKTKLIIPPSGMAPSILRMTPDQIKKFAIGHGKGFAPYKKR